MRPVQSGRIGPHAMSQQRTTTAVAPQTAAGGASNPFRNPDLIRRGSAALEGDGLLTPAETAAVLRCGMSKLWADTASGKLPQPVRLGHRTTRFRAADLRAYLASLAADQEVKA